MSPKKRGVRRLKSAVLAAGAITVLCVAAVSIAGNSGAEPQPRPCLQASKEIPVGTGRVMEVHIEEFRTLGGVPGPGLTRSRLMGRQIGHSGSGVLA